MGTMVAMVEGKSIIMLIIFDLDGVLVESKDMHYQTLNHALEQVHKDYVIDYVDHIENYDGLPTKRKLELLTANKGLPTKFYNQIQQEKQRLTIVWLGKLQPDQNLITVFRHFKNQNYKIAVASNSIRESVKTALLSLHLMEFIDYFVSNEDVHYPKPFPEMYWKCMTNLNSLPIDTIILEDSPIGREGALASGGHLLPIDSPNDITIKLIQQLIDEIKL